MPLRPQDLARDLERGLKPVYLVSGDETLLVQEACDQMIAAARANGFDERVLIQVEAGFQMARADRSRRTRCRCSRSVGCSMCACRPSTSTKTRSRRCSRISRVRRKTPLLLLRTERPRHASAQCRVVQEDRVGRRALCSYGRSAPRNCRAGLRSAARRVGLEISSDALSYLANSVEGNLLAAAQEIEKLALSGLPQPITLAALTSAVADAAHYDAFDLVDAALEGEARRVRHIVWVLRAEGVAVLAVLGSLTVQLRRFLNDDVRGMPQAKERAMRSAAKRLRKRDIEDLIAQAARIDQQVKGAAAGDPWQTLEVCRVASRRRCRCRLARDRLRRS